MKNCIEIATFKIQILQFMKPAQLKKLAIVRAALE